MEFKYFGPYVLIVGLVPLTIWAYVSWYALPGVLIILLVVHHLDYLLAKKRGTYAGFYRIIY